MVQRQTDIKAPAVTTQPISAGGGESPFLGIGEDVGRFLTALQADSIQEEKEDAQNYEATLKNTVDEMARKYGDTLKNNPQKMQAEFSTELKGFLGKIPNKGLRARIESRGFKALGPFVTKANNNSVTIINAEGAARKQLKKSTDNALLLSGSKKVFSNDPAEVKASSDWIDTLRTDLITTLSEMGMTPDGEPFPLFFPEEVAKDLNEFNDTWISSGLREWDAQQLDPTESIVELREGGGPQVDAFVESVGEAKTSGGISEQDITRKIVKVAAINKLTEAGREAFFKELNAKLPLKNAITTKDEKIAENAKKIEVAGNDFEELLKAKDLPPGAGSTEAQRLLENVRNGTNSKQGAKDALAALTTEPAIKDNRDIVITAQVGIANEKDMKDFIVANVGEMRAETFRTLLTSNKTTLDDSIESLKTGPESLDKIAKNARDGLIRIVGGRTLVDPTDPFSAITPADPARAQVLNTVLDLFDQGVDFENGTIDGKPITVFTAGELRDRLILQSRETTNADMVIGKGIPKEGRRTLIRPRFLSNPSLSRSQMTPEEVGSAMIQTSVEAVNGTIDRQDLLLEIREIKRWEQQFINEGFLAFDQTLEGWFTSNAIERQARGQ